MHKLFLTFLMGLSALFGGYHAQMPLGSTYQPARGQTYTLQSSIGTTNNTIPLSSFKEPISGIPFTMSYLGTSIAYGTLDPQQPTRAELISFTGITQNSNGTALLTGVSRGLSNVYPFAASTTLAVAHSGQSYFILSDAPQVFAQYPAKMNAESIVGLWTFSSTSVPQLDQNPNFNTLASTTFATIGYVASTSFAGTVNATESVKGISELALGSEAASGASTGGTGARLVLPASLATSTCQSIQNSVIIASTTTGRIDKGCIDQTLNYSWSGSTTFTGTTTLAATTTITGHVSGPLLSVLTASSTFTGAATPQAFFIATTTGTAVLTDSNNAANSTFAGFIVTSGTNGQTVYAQTDGVVPGFTGLIPGSDYYATTTGTIQNTAGSVREIYVGAAISSTQILINRNRAMQFNGSTTITVTNNGYLTAVIPALTRFINITTSGPFASYQLTVDTTNNKTVTVGTGIDTSGTSAGSQSFTASSSGSVLGMTSFVSSGGGSAVASIIFYR